MHDCPVCGSKLQEITDGKNRGVRCSERTCPFNYQDLSFPECGAAVAAASLPALNTYELQCGKGHTWRHTE